MISESTVFSSTLHRRDVVVAAEPARDVAERQRLAFERRDDADDVLRADRRDHHDLQLLGRQAERLRVHHAAARRAPARTRSGDTDRP